MKHFKPDPWRRTAGVASVVLWSLPLTAQADDWGCQVLLCLSDPRGPRTEAPCRPPIDRLYRALAKGHAFPVCTLAGSPQTGGSYAQPVFDPYDPCPAGLRAAEPGRYVVQGKPVADSRRSWQRYDLDGTPAVSQPGTVDLLPVGASFRACVGRPVGAYHVSPGGGDDPGYTVNVFDAVLWQRPQSPRAIDVYIDSQRYRRIRY
jgi:hypothetical protein